jgi:hypothetical protein
VSALKKQLNLVFFQKMNPIFWLVFFIILGVFYLLFGRRLGESNVIAEPSFYFWKTNAAPTFFEKKRLNSLNIKQLSLHLFDIDVENEQSEPKPIGITNVDSTWNVHQSSASEMQIKTITGCIFITNRVFENKKLNVEKLAENTLQLVIFLEKKLPKNKLDELQIDCDWTATTRENFFLFLKKIQKIRPDLPVSATIRLHQFRFPKETGVPPVSHGILMFYNTGEITDWATENSILDSTDANKFLWSRKIYPLPLDIALPIFKWGIVFRDSAFFKIINNLDSAQLMDNQRFTSISTNRFSVKKETFLEGILLREGDLIRLEASEPAQIKWAARQIQRLRQTSFTRTAPDLKLWKNATFYHLDSASIREFSDAFFQKILQTVNKN